jgi:Tfp pilus assembly protein PilO
VNARNGLLIGLLVTVVAGFGFYTLALKPKRQEVAKLDKDIATQEQALQAAQTLLATNERARERFRQAYSTVVRLGKAVPADDDVRSLVVQLHAAARQADVDFASIRLSSAGGTDGASATQLPPGATVGPAGFPTMQFSLEFRGKYFGLGEFLRRLHGFVEESNDSLQVSGRLLTLDSVNLTPQTEGMSDIAATVTATTYLVSPLEGLTGGATGTGPAGAAAPAAGAATGGTTAAPSGTAASGEGTSPLPAPASATSTGGIR